MNIDDADHCHARKPVLLLLLFLLVCVCVCVRACVRVCAHAQYVYVSFANSYLPLFVVFLRTQNEDLKEGAVSRTEDKNTRCLFPLPL